MSLASEGKEAQGVTTWGWDVRSARGGMFSSQQALSPSCCPSASLVALSLLQTHLVRTQAGADPVQIQSILFLVLFVVCPCDVTLGVIFIWAFAFSL